MKSPVWLILLVTLGLITGCSQAENNAENFVRERLKDPESANFRDLVVRQFKGKDAVCGQVNAKNGFGAYVGFQKFVYIEAPWKDVFYIPSPPPSSTETWDTYAQAYATVCLNMSEQEYQKMATDAARARAEINKLKLAYDDAEMRASALVDNYEAQDEATDLKFKLDSARSDYQAKYWQVDPFKAED